MVPFIGRWPVTAKQIIEDGKLNRVIIWAESEAKFKDEVKDDGIDEGEWVWKGEYVFIFSMDKSGEKIERMVEFWIVRLRRKECCWLRGQRQTWKEGRRTRVTWIGQFKVQGAV
jgi:hypothetical protein